MLTIPTLIATLVIGQAVLPVPKTQAQEDYAKFSLRLELGATWYGDIADQDIDTGPYISIGGVYAIPMNDTLYLTFGSDLSYRDGDANGSFSDSRIKSSKGKYDYTTTTDWNGDIETYALMFNVGIEQTFGSNTHYGWGLETGLQFGVAWNQGEVEGTVDDGYSVEGFSFRETSVNLAWGAFVGGFYAFENNMKASVGFKYFDAGEVANMDVDGVNLYAGFSYGF